MFRIASQTVTAKIPDDGEAAPPVILDFHDRDREHAVDAAVNVCTVTLPGVGRAVFRFTAGGYLIDQSYYDQETIDAYNKRRMEHADKVAAAQEEAAKKADEEAAKQAAADPDPGYVNQTLDEYAAAQAAGKAGEGEKSVGPPVPASGAPTPTQASPPPWPPETQPAPNPGTVNKASQF